MTSGVPEVRPLSRAAIESMMERLVAGYSPETLLAKRPFPIGEYCDSQHVEDMGLMFRVDDLPEGTEGRLDGREFVIDTRVYTNLLDGDRRARFTFAHELGHALLHRDQIRAINTGIRGTVALHRRGNLPAYRDPEWQANVAAAAILMPKQAIQRLFNDHGVMLLAHRVSDALHVSMTAAMTRISQLKKEGVLN